MTQQPPPERPRYDQPLKLLLRRGHDGFLALVAPGVTWRGERSPELPAAPVAADLVWEVEEQGQPLLFHIENQTNVDPLIGERVANYALQVWRRDHLAVRSLVVYLRPEANTPAPPFVITLSGREVLRYEYEVLRLWEMDPAWVLDTPWLDLWPLAGVMVADAAAAKAVAARIVGAPASARERAELLRTTLLLAGLRLRAAALAEVVEDIRRNPMIEDIWQESSLATVLEERGRAEGARAALRTIVEVRFGAVPEALEQHIAAADEPALKALTVRAVEAPSLADLLASLAERPS
jgi:hypothetical protein